MNSTFNDNLKSARRGFTLVEMLFVVAIIGVLGAMTAGILGKAHKDAKFAASRSRITQIEAIMQSVTEDFEVRRMPFRNADLPGPNRTANLNLSRRIKAAMLMAEYPGPVFSGTDFETNPNAGQLDLPAALSAFVPPTAEMQFWQTIAGDANLDLPGEYLYLILERINIDGSSALESLGPNVVANNDEDAYPEIVDAFGDSMQLRILQVADTNVEETDWTLTDSITGLPTGYVLLDPSLPRSMHYIRFQVVSPNVEEVE